MLLRRHKQKPQAEPQVKQVEEGKPKKKKGGK